MAENAKKAAKPKEAKPKAERKPREKRVAGLPTTAKISLLKDEKGVKYGPDNNPKRRDAGKRFAKYRDGMTVAEYLKAGGRESDVTYDKKVKFIGLAA